MDVSLPVGHPAGSRCPSLHNGVAGESLLLVHLLTFCPWWLQAIERCGTGITYAQLLYNMSQALEQLSAQQGKLPPKLPGEIGGLFGGLVNKLVRAQAPLCLFPAIGTLFWRNSRQQLFIA